MLEDMEPVGPCVLVIFGAGGDLAKRLLFPALYNLAGEALLPREFAVVGFARAKVSEEDFRLGLRRDLPESPGLDSCLLYTSPSPRDRTRSRMPSSA